MPVSRLLFAALLFTSAAAADLASAQAAGDVAIVGFRADDPDEFALVALAPVPGGTEIAFTDNGWRSTGEFRATEGTFRYTVPATGLAPGAVVEFSGFSGPAFAAAGDQLLAYVGPDDAPTFLYALNVEGDATWQADATSSNTSALPTGLANGTTAVAVQEADNVAYAGPTSGTRAELLAAIGDPSNWAGDNTGRPAFPAAFTVTGSGGNLPPAFTSALTDRAAVAGDPFTFDYDAVDPDGDALTYALTQGPAGAAIDPVSGELGWTPSAVQAGQAYAVTVTASDGMAEAATTATLTVLAEAPDLPPAFADPTYAIVTDASGPVSVTYAAADPEGTAVTYALASGAASAAVNPSTGAFSWTAPAEPGVYPFVVSATDGAGLAARVDLFVGVRGPLFPGQTGGALRAAVRAAYAGTTLGYTAGRDTLYARVSGYPGGVVEGVYTGFSVQLDPSQDPSAYLDSRGINAEHTWPQSMGAGSEPQRSDMHILYPAKSNVNGSRGNDPYGEVEDAETLTWYRGAEQQATIPPAATRDEWSERGPAFFEPREAVKGDLARAALYFATVYEAAADAGFLAEQVDALVAWDAADPASAAEVLRSGLVARYQGNVNPFVLDPTLAVRAFDPFATGAEEAAPGALSVAVGPNPTRGPLAVRLTLPAASEVRVAVYDALGRRVAEVEAALPSGVASLPLDLSRLRAGVYAVRVQDRRGGVVVERATVVR